MTSQPEPENSEEQTSKADATESETKSDSLTHVAEDLIDKPDHQKVRLGELLEAIENRGYGPLILIPAFLSASPLGTIPGYQSLPAR